MDAPHTGVEHLTEEEWDCAVFGKWDTLQQETRVRSHLAQCGRCRHLVIVEKSNNPFAVDAFGAPSTAVNSKSYWRRMADFLENVYRGVKPL